MWRGLWWLLLLSGTALGAGSPSVVLTKENVVEASPPKLEWKSARIGQELFERDRLRTGELSRASVRLTTLAVLRLNELTELELRAPERGYEKPTLDLKGGSIFFFSREKPSELHLRTPLATGALRGTEFHAEVGANGRTVVTMFEGEVELSNALGRLTLRSGEQGTVEPGRPPVKTAVLDATNIIQWCLYYPGVVSIPELKLSAAEKRALAPSLALYEQGDLLGALRAWPAGRAPVSEGERTYRAALLLCVGQVPKAERELGKSGSPALRRLIAAVKFREQAPASPRTAGEWLAESYYQQSRSNLVAARAAARSATEADPAFGFAWTRLAELEFSFGDPSRAMKTLERGTTLAPRQAQARALEGFYLAAQNRLGAARQSFQAALDLDGALGNAWLGRGLTQIRHGDAELGRQDLQTAAALEPNRSVLRSYLGKAFSQVGIAGKAHREFDRAKEIDAHDPTPWLYSAIQRKQENRYNDAIDELETSYALNDNRRVYRSQFLLDQDRAIRGTNLAAIYQNDGLREQSVREAVRAVGDDFASAPAHLFLANAYDALRDPQRVQLRYETAWANELLLSHLLSPVGGGPLSQYVSEQEYSKLFERDGLGFSSVTELFSRGELRETASQYGTSGNLSYALDYETLLSNGTRPNNDLARHEGYATFKLQLGPRDTLFSQIRFQDLQSGYLFQQTDPHVEAVPALTYRYREEQMPGQALVGWHHEWAPGQHTLLLVSRLADDQTLASRSTGQNELTRGAVREDDATLFAEGRVRLPGEVYDAFAAAYAPGTEPEIAARLQPLVPSLRPFAGRGDIRDFETPAYDLEYQTRFESFTAELQQICTFGPQTLLVGGRYQHGEFETYTRLRNRNGLGDELVRSEVTDKRALEQTATASHERFGLYLYDRLRLTRWLALTAGVTYDALRYPENYLSPPISSRESELERVSPKVGLTLQPWRGATWRAAYAQATSGTSFDESVRLEPVQVEGFLQSYRSAISESLTGPLPGNRYEVFGLALEQKLPTRTYFGAEWTDLRQRTDRHVGDLEHFEVGAAALGNVAGDLEEKLSYREQMLTASLHQLVGRDWSFGVRYRYTQAELERRIPELRGRVRPEIDAERGAGVKELARSRAESRLHELGFLALCNHPTGLFARGEANWYQQDNEELSGDDFWQVNLLTGYRFYRNQCELSGGLLNVFSQDYRLSPLTPYLELAREPTWVLRMKLTF